jgi:thiol-disulfide isomerase/thioredoxin
MTLKQRGDSLWGTIATPTGDYRYLAGTRSQDKCCLQTFDGAHLFGFFFDVSNGDSLKGSFISGSHYVSGFNGSLSATPNNTSLSNTYQTTDNQSFILSGVGLDGQDISIEFNERLGPMVVDIMGSWCPNCMDETRLLNELSAAYPNVPIVSMAYERSTGEEAIRRLQAFQAEMNTSWPVILAGPASKQHASDQFPILNGVQSFPTTLFWGGPSECVVHSGFSGPATGEGYKEEQRLFRAQFQRLNGLLETR